MSTELNDEYFQPQIIESYINRGQVGIWRQFYRLYSLLDSLAAIDERVLLHVADGTLTEELAKQMEKEAKDLRQEFEKIRNAFFVISGLDPLEVIIANTSPECGRALMRRYVPLPSQF